MPYCLAPGFQTCEAVEVELGGQEIRGGWPLRNTKNSKRLNCSSSLCSQTWDASRAPLALGCSKQHLYSAWFTSIPSSSHPHCCSSLPRSLQQPLHWSYYIQYLHPTSLIFTMSPREFLKRIWDTITLLLKNAPWQKLNQSNAIQFWVSWGRNECMLPVETCTGIGLFFF